MSTLEGVLQTPARAAFLILWILTTPWPGWGRKGPLCRRPKPRHIASGSSPPAQQVMTDTISPMWRLWTSCSGSAISSLKWLPKSRGKWTCLMNQAQFLKNQGNKLCTRRYPDRCVPTRNGGRPEGDYYCFSTVLAWIAWNFFFLIMRTYHFHKNKSSFQKLEILARNWNYFLFCLASSNAELGDQVPVFLLKCCPPPTPWAPTPGGNHFLREKGNGW